MKRKSALITGICGQDGSYLADLLLEKDYNVYGIMRRNATNNLENAKHLENVVDIIEGDITDMSSMLRIIESVKPHEIYNMAALSHVHTSFEQPLATLDIDTKGLVNILEIIRCLRPQTRIFHCSTSEMFGSAFPPQNLNTPFVPQSPYAIAKVASHHFVRLYREAYKMYVCAGATFNHECFFYKTPVMLKKDNYIDICYVGDLVQNRKDHNHDGSVFTKNYENERIEIWDGENFVKLKAVSRKKLINLDKENQQKRITNTPHGIVFTTPNHKLFNIESQKFEAREFKKGDLLLHGLFPKNFVYMNSITEDMSKLYGLLCADGFVDGGIRLSNNSKDIQDEFIKIISKCFSNTKFKIKSCISEFNGISTQIDISGISKQECLVIRSKIYDKKTKHKKVPTEVLNGSLEIKMAFLEGYYLGDGQKAGNGNYKYKSFKTNSPLLAQGLLYILKYVCPEQDYCLNNFQQNDKNYIHVNLNSPNESGKSLGKHFKKDRNAISKIMNVDEDNQHIFDIETESGKVCAGVGKMIVGNSERRGPNFVTRKITMGVAKCLKDPSYRIKLGNLDAKRDWGYSPDFCEGFWLSLQQDIPDDYVFATGEMHSVKEFCESAFSLVDLNWEDYVIVDRFFMRPSEVPELCGDYSDTEKKIGWEPKVKFEELVRIMVISDCKLLGVLPDKLK